MTRGVTIRVPRILQEVTHITRRGKAAEEGSRNKKGKFKEYLSKTMNASPYGYN